jgi:hypothetical protein
MEDRLRELEERLARLEAATAHLVPADGERLTLPLPLRFVNASGATVIELSADGDGGLLCINNAKGAFRVLLGSGPDGGWVDVIDATQRLAVTLTTHDEGGSIEYSQNGVAYAVVGERYWPPEEDEASV